MTAGRREPWWKGTRGEWLVVVQVILMALVFFGPRTISGRPEWTFPAPRALPILGGALMVLGASLLFAGLFRLGGALTPLPYPKDGVPLLETGPFALVRHPMYGGGILLAFGWALIVRSWLTIGYAIALFAFLDFKSRREERWLTERFPGYRRYQSRVRKLIPFLY